MKKNKIKVPEPEVITRETKITIIDADGKISVTGPMTNKVVFLGLLEVAKQIMLEYNKSLEAKAQGG